MAGTGVQTVHVSVGFSEEANEYRPTKIVFEMDDRRDAEQLDNGAVRIRHYPGQPYGSFSDIGSIMVGDGSEYGYRYMVTEGDLLFTNEIRERRVTGTVVFTGGVEADLPYPVLRGMEYYVDGDMFSEFGVPIDGFIRFDQYNQKLVSSRPVYGTVRYNYVTSYRIIRYIPTNYYADAVFYAIDEVNYGQLFAFPLSSPVDKQPNVTHFAIHPPTGAVTQFELLRVVSEALVADDGIHELPVDFQNGGITYPGKPAFSSTSYVVVERVHKIYYLHLGDPNKLSIVSSSTSLPNSEGAVARNDGDKTIALNVGRQVVASDRNIQAKKSKARATLSQHRYDVPWGIPYENEVPEPVIRVIEVERDGVRVRRDTITLQYTRSIKVKASPPPTSPSITGDGYTARVDEYQSRVNDILDAAMRAIDWRSLRAEIIASFDPQLYTIEFDSSVPNPQTRV